MAAVRLAVTSDLHLPITSAERIGALAREMAAFRPDAAVLAGDLGESLDEVTRCMKLFTDALTCPVWVLPGNHDVWARPPHDSHRLWRELLPAAVTRAGGHWLEGSCFVLGETAVAGTVAWYDYSAAGPAVKATALQFAQQKMQHNADALRIDWEWSDPEFADRVAAPFLATLDHLEADPAVRRVVVVTHVPLVEGQMHRISGDELWGFSNAYFGNFTLGNKVLKYRKVSHLLSGHTHHGRECVVPREGAPAVEARTLASDYEEPAWVGLTF